MTITIEKDVLEAIYTLLVERAGAHESYRQDFLYHFPGCVEFRFMGSLGFGGKIWCDGGRVYIDCYRENETPERLTLIALVNTRIAELMSHG